jgi:hypothetical protein
LSSDVSRVRRNPDANTPREPKRVKVWRRRSRLLNDMPTLPDVDGRSTWCKRRRDLINLYTKTYGRNLTALEITDIATAASAQVRIEQLQCGIPNGAARPRTDEEMVRLGNLVQRILAEQRKRKVGDKGSVADKGEDVRAYLAKLVRGDDA